MAQPPLTQQQQPQPQGLDKLMPGQAAIADQFANQAKPFGWLMDMIAHITGQGQAPQPGQPGQAPGQPQQQQPAQKPGAGKQSDASSAPPGNGTQPGGEGGAIDPSQVPALASVVQPNAMTNNMGLMPQVQGSFGWLLQMMQKQQMQQQQAQQGGDLVSLVGGLVGGGSPGLDLQGGTAPKATAKAASKPAGKG